MIDTALAPHTPLPRLFGVLPHLRRQASMWAASLASRTVRVRTATTERERHSIYRCRYEIYVEERQRRDHAAADHRRRWIRHPDDEAPSTRLFYVGTPERVVASVRTRLWRPGELPDAIRSHYAVDLLPGLDTRVLTDATLLSARREVRGGRVILGLTCASGMATILQGGAEAVLSTCAPGLLRGYARLGFRDFGVASRADVLLVPLVCLLGDLQCARAVGSPWYPSLRALARRGILSQDTPAELRATLAGRSRSQSEPALILAELRALLRNDRRFHRLAKLDRGHLDRLARRSTIIEVGSGTQVTTPGVREREAYCVLSGSLSGEAGRHLGAGQLFGAPDPRAVVGATVRRERVRAETRSRLLVVAHSLLCGPRRLPLGDSCRRREG